MSVQDAVVSTVYKIDGSDGEVWRDQLFEHYALFFFQAGDGIRYAQGSRGLGDVYKRQTRDHWFYPERTGMAETTNENLSFRCGDQR